ncbi:hypothetical protein QIH97_gp20 [Enterobacter phage KNP3]|nr:hypothetical protein QIH97_gp20 [Enterobacter phage KNP3]
MIISPIIEWDLKCIKGHCIT